MTYINYRNLRFMLYEVLDAPQLKRLNYYEAYDKEAFDMALDAAKQISDTVLYPYFTEMDRDKAKFEHGNVKRLPNLNKFIETIADGGWISAHATFESGGQQMPLCLLNAGLMSFYASNICSTYCFLTSGAANLIQSFGNEALKNAYIPNLYNGKWQGTMALTEPQAGSSLMDLLTTAEPTEDGFYKIKGQKIYISGGDHGAADNFVHLLLARIKGAPKGSKGISLFVVPKFRPENDTLVPNDVITAGLFGKMGQRGYTAVHLMMGEKEDCRGWLVGEPNQGLSYMFQMMNEARIGTGLLAASTASAAYYAALKYANERSQGRHPSNKDPNSSPVLIIEHADVRRMLLFQKAIVEGSIALLLQCSYWADLSNAATGEEKENAHLLLELLTPIAKSFPSEGGIVAIKYAMQTLGGAGYCEDFPIEQYYREIPINSIYEGTTTIHGMDILGRKVMMKGGAAFGLFANEVQKTIQSTTDAKLLPFGQQLVNALANLMQTSTSLFNLAKESNPETFLADATLYLELFGHVTIAWQWLKQANVAQSALNNANLSEDETNFYQGKIHTMQYYFEYELPKIEYLKARLESHNHLTVNIKNEFIN